MNRAQIFYKTAIAYISALGGIEIKHIEHGIDDYIYCISNAWYGKPKAHRVKIYYTDDPYIVLRGQIIRLDEAIRCY